MTSLRPQGLSPHIFVKGAEEAADFYRAAFGATEVFRNRLPDGTLLFIELWVGAGRLLVSEETPSLNAPSPRTLGGSPVLILLEVEDVEALARQAIAAGAEVEMPVEEMFWGERYGVLRDPFGHRWAISTAREQLTPDEIIDRSPPSV